MLKVSVIITAFGTPVLLEKAIKSVLNQTLDRIELIIVDDNNPDTEARVLTEKIINNFSKSDINIIYVKHESNKNGATARNTGLSIAQGKYISFLDSDDEYLFERLKKCYCVMEKSSEKIAGVYTGCEFKKDGKRFYVHKKITSGCFLITTLASTFMFCTGSNIFVRKSVFDELNGFDNNFLRHQDYEFLVRLFEKYSLEAISEVLVIKNNENINLPNIYKMIDIKEQFLAKYKSIIQNLHIKHQNYIYHSNYIQIAEMSLKNKQFSQANEYYLKAKKYSSMSLRNRFRKILLAIYNNIN